MLHQSSAEDAVVHTCITPRVVLLVFTAVNFLLYFDRGATAGALSAIRSDSRVTDGGHALSDSKSGFLVSGFTIGYVFASPLFAARGTEWGSRSVILLGMALWCVTCLGCAVSTSYAALLLCRVLVGVAEAAFVGFTVTIIDNIAPPARRTSWIGFFYAMIPVGTAAGMGCGGFLTTYTHLLGVPPWRVMYVAEVVVASPIVALLFYIPAHYHIVAAADTTATTSFLAASRRVLGNANYMLLVLGLSTYCFVTGAVSTWGIPLLHEGPLQFSKGAAAAFMGIVTTVSGVVGSLIGGLLVDHLGGSTGAAGTLKCAAFSVSQIVLAMPCGVVALLSTTYAIFAVGFCVSVVALFAVTAPVNAAILSVVPPELRPYAVSYSVFLIHLLGDFPSPTLAGIASDAWGRACRGHDLNACAAAEPSLRCGWVDDGGGRGRCVSRVQLRNALLLVFAYMTLAIPCWAALCWRLRRGMITAAAATDVSVEDAADVSTESQQETPTPSVLASARDDLAGARDVTHSVKRVTRCDSNRL